LLLVALILTVGCSCTNQVPKEKKERINIDSLFRSKQTEYLLEDTHVIAN
jgi:hypothetical protein